MQQKVKLTVFTPAYNRAHTLGRCYESMLKQKCKDFKWLIIDDGSTDNTKELVDSWLNKDNGFEIIYKYKFDDQFLAITNTNTNAHVDINYQHFNQYLETTNYVLVVSKAKQYIIFNKDMPKNMN